MGYTEKNRIQKNNCMGGSPKVIERNNQLNVYIHDIHVRVQYYMK